MLKLSLKGQRLVPADAVAMQISASHHHGQVQAVMQAMERLGIAELLHSRSSVERDCAMAMIAARVIEPDTKLATTRWWHATTLPCLFGVSHCDEDDLYHAMDWLLTGQARIEKKLAARHLDNDALALYDLSSSYVEGTACPLAVSVFAGNVGDSQTLLTQVQKLREDFALEQCALVGDRGMITQTQIRQLQGTEGVDWITALRPEAIRKLVHERLIQMTLFDERNLFSFIHPDFPGERLLACRNPALATRREQKRQSLIDATIRELEKVSAMAGRARLTGQDRIGVRVGKVVNKYKVAKHFTLDIGDDHFRFTINQESVAAEAALDGIYVIRTSLEQDVLSDEDTVRSYKSLSQVERAFRSLKAIDLQVRPIHHRLEDGTPVHSFRTLLTELSSIVRNTCHIGDTGASIEIITTPTAKQQQALELLKQITV